MSKDFKCLGCEISCENETHIQHKLVKFVQVHGIPTTLLNQI
jgi:hypothetical protein